MNTTIRTTTSHHAGSRVRARRVGTLSVAAGALACVALAPAVAHASQLDGKGGGGAPAYVSNDIDDVVAARKHQMTEDYVGAVPSRAVVASRSAPATFAVHAAGCDISGTLDEWSRRLIAIQVCGKAYVVTAAAFRAPVRYAEPIPFPQAASAGSVGHCGHQGMHQPPATGLPVSAWFTPTSC